MVLFLLIFSFQGFSEKLTVLAELTDPSILEIDGQEIFILDEARVYVYSLQDYGLIRQFGKKGEGPGELKTLQDIPITMQVFKEYVLLNSYNKIVFFSKSGKMLKEKRIPFLAFQIVPFGKNYAVTKFTRSPDGGSQLSVLLFNPKFEELKRLYETELQNDMRKKKIAFPFAITFSQCSGDRLLVVDQKKEFEILRFDLEGNRLVPIKKPYQKIPVSETFKKESWEWLKLQPSYKLVPERLTQMIYFPEYLPVIRNLLVKEQKIYLQTYKTKDSLSEFFILDLQGRVEKTLFLPGASKDRQIRPNPAVTYTFKGDEYYYLEEDMEEEEWNLHKVTWTSSFPRS